MTRSKIKCFMEDFYQNMHLCIHVSMHAYMQLSIYTVNIHSCTYTHIYTIPVVNMPEQK
jgi:hypothetical protein